MGRARRSVTVSQRFAVEAGRNTLRSGAPFPDLILGHGSVSRPLHSAVV